MMIAPFELSQADSRPMYQQITDNIKRLILNGQWPPGQPLPSIRELAVAIKVSVITVKRAYQELEREQVIYTRHGLGSFVAQQAGAVKEQKRKELEALVDQLVELTEVLAIDEKALTTMIRERTKLHREKG